MADNLFGSLATEHAKVEPETTTQPETVAKSATNAPGLFDSLKEEIPEEEPVIEAAEPEVQEEEEPVAVRGVSDDVASENLRMVMEEIAKQGQTQRRQPLAPYQMPPLEYYQQRYGDNLDESAIRAMFDMQNEIASHNINAYHQAMVYPEIARLAHDNEEAKEAMQAELMSQKPEFSGIRDVLVEMKTIIANNPHIKQMPVDERMEYAYFKAYRGKMPEMIKRIEQQGRNNERRDMARTFRTPAATGGRSPARDGKAPKTQEELNFARKMGL